MRASGKRRGLGGDGPASVSSKRVRVSADRSGKVRRGTKQAGRGGIDSSGKDRSGEGDLYAQVTQRIVGELEAGRVPWVQPWGCAGGADAGLPRNAVTRRTYSGINILLLWAAGLAHRHPSHGWLTFRQAQAAGGSVRKGERGTCIVYADRFIPHAERVRAEADGEDPRALLFLRRFTVFNVAQCEGLDQALAAGPALLAPADLSPVGEELIAASRVAIRIGGTHAFYAPEPDFVAIPPQSLFFEPLDYYRTAFHELTHATGHISRLARDQIGSFGSKAYAVEELIAELGAAFLCAALGIPPSLRHADHLAAWLAVLRADARIIFRAASAASKASDWLLARLQAGTRAEGGAA